MRTFTGEGFGRTIVINLDRGELLLEGIRAALSDQGIRDAVLVSAIGTLTVVRYHRITGTGLPPRDEILTIEAPMELSAVQGIVAGGEPHLHMVFTDLNQTYSGHLEDGCEVTYLAELVFAELRGLALKREKNAAGIRMLQKA